MKETKLPDQPAFYNKLSDEECTPADYAYAHRVWKLQGCSTLKDYHDLYLMTDVLLLADFFEKFRDMCMENYGLDCAHYFSAPGMAIDVALKVSGTDLELLDNETMYTFFEKSI